MLRFRKVIELVQVPEHFLVDVSADNQFILFVNKQSVGSGPSRSDLAHWKYESYDLAPFLRPGKNVLAATVWNFGTNAALNQITDRTAFLLRGNGEAERVADTNDTWQVEQETGIRTLPVQIRGYYAADPGLRIDAAKCDWSWNSETNTASSWTKAAMLGRGSPRGETDPPRNWQLVPDGLPQMEMKLESAGTVVRVTRIGTPPGVSGIRSTIPARTKASLLVDNGILTTAYPALSVSGGAGSTIRVTYSEALIDDKGDKGNRNQIEGKHIEGLADEFLPDGQAREFMPLTWRTWRFLQIDVETGEQPLEIVDLKNWFTAYPFEERAYFRADDASLKPIWDIGWRTARLDAHDTYMDTPYWERLQYVGDTRIQALISYTVAGDDRLARQAIEAFDNSRIPEGLTQSRYPTSLHQVIPTFSLLWVGMVHDFWMYRNDAEFVRAQLPGTRAVMGWYLRHRRADGLVGKIPWWPFVDWGGGFDFGMPPQDDDGGSAVITLQFVEALRYAADLENAVGDPRQAAGYRAAAARAADAVRKLCWNQKYGLLADTPAQQHFSQQANILGVWLDVIPREQQKEVLIKTLSTSDKAFTTSAQVPRITDATYYFRFYLARALDHVGMGDRYLDLLGPWRKMLTLGLTTWAESPEGPRSDSHAWSSHPNYDLLTIVAGIRPSAAGFKSIRIEPHLGALKQVSAAMPTPQGMVEANYTRSQGSVRAEITMPQGTSGTLVWNGKETALHEGKQTLTLDSVR